MTIRLIKFNEVPKWWCGSCGDSGLIEVCHVSTDALLFYRECDCKYPPIWKLAPSWKLSDVERIAKRREQENYPF